MHNLRRLLTDADPLRHEAPPTDSRHDELRRLIVASAAGAPRALPTAHGISRRALLATAAAGIGTLTAIVWLRQETPVLAAMRFEVRLAETSPAPGLIVARVADSGSLVYLHPETIVSNEDIAQSFVVQEGTSYAVTVELFRGGAERMRQATTAHLGQPVAILLDNTVVMAPVVRSPISDSAKITGTFTRAEAERIAKAITP